MLFKGWDGVRRIAARSTRLRVFARFKHFFDLFRFDSFEEVFKGIDSVIFQDTIEVCHGEFAQAQKPFHFLSIHRQFGFQVDSQYADCIDDRGQCHAGEFRIGLEGVPRSLRLDVSIGLIGQGHDVANDCTILECFIRWDNLGLLSHHPIDQGPAVCVKLPEPPFQLFRQHGSRSRRQIGKLAYEIGVDLVDKIFDAQVQIVHAVVEFTRIVVAQVFRIEMLGKGRRLHKGTTRLTHLLAIHG